MRFPENTISASGNVRVSVTGNEKLSTIFASWVRVGGVDGTLLCDRSILGRWTFTRGTAGDPVRLPGVMHVYFSDESKRN